MIFRYYKPSPDIKFFVQEYLLAHFIFDKPTSVPPKIYPVAPEQGFTFYIKGFVVAETPNMAFSEKRPRSVMWGQSLHSQNLNVGNSEEYLMVNVNFYPGALFKLFGIPMTELVHKNIDAEAIFGKMIWEVNEKLANAHDYQTMIAIIDNFFIEKVMKLKEGFSHPIERIPQLILQNPTQFNLTQLASKSCLCNSQFERKFLQQVGVTPKFFANICRFSQAFQLKEQNPNLDWFSVAIETGYYDYQHLAKDFKRFAGNTPTTLISLYEQSPESFLKLI